MCEFGLRVGALLDLQRGRLGGRRRQLPPPPAPRALSLPRPLAPLPPLPLPLPLTTYRGPNCLLNINNVPPAVGKKKQSDDKTKRGNVHPVSRTDVQTIFLCYAPDVPSTRPIHSSARSIL